MIYLKCLSYLLLYFEKTIEKIVEIPKRELVEVEKLIERPIVIEKPVYIEKTVPVP